jgi:hypothetical protein
MTHRQAEQRGKTGDGYQQVISEITEKQSDTKKKMILLI